MKSIYKLLILGLVTVVFVLCVFIIENNKMSPLERYEARIDKFEKNIDASNSVLNNTQTVNYDFISYEWIEDNDISSQLKYKSDYFYDECLPDPDYLVEQTDWSKMRIDYPLFDEYVASNGNSGLTDSEYEVFINQHYLEYTVYVHPKTRYLFLHCIISNVGNKQTEECIALLRLMIYRDNKLIGGNDIMCYFDKPQHIYGDDRLHNYFFYLFKSSEEAIDCYIGFEISEQFIDLTKENDYYVGFVPEGIEDYSQFNPKFDPAFVNLKNIHEETRE